MELSLCMIVKNEEAYLEQCLLSVRDAVDEIIIGRRIVTGHSGFPIVSVQHHVNVAIASHAQSAVTAVSFLGSSFSDPSRKKAPLGETASLIVILPLRTSMVYSSQFSWSEERM